MTKAQLWEAIQNEVSEVFAQNKVSKKAQEAIIETLKAYIAPKVGRGSIQHPPKLDEDGNIVEAYCRFHQRYEPIENMVVSKGKSKGYCKASISKWNKINSQIKKLDSKAVDLMAKGKLEEAQEVAKEAKELKDALNNPEAYNYEEDWEAFSK